MFTGPRIFNDYDLSNMLWYIDTSNPDCWDRSGISSNTKFYNLAQTDGSEYFYPYETTYATEDNYELTEFYIERKYHNSGTNNTSFRSNVNKEYFTSATTGAVSGFVFLNGKVGTAADNQGAQNIYLGGIPNRMSFSLSGGGNTQWGGVLIYNNGGTGGLAHRTYSTGELLNGNWRSLGYTAVASGGNTLTITLFQDGIQVSQGTYSISDTDGNRLPHGSSAQTVMGGWSSGYGEFTGKYNNWMYFNTELDATDFQQLHNAFKPKFNGL